MQDQNNPDPLLTLDNACVYLGVRKSALYRLTSENRIRYYKVAGENRFRQSDLDAYLESCVVECR